MQNNNVTWTVMQLGGEAVAVTTLLAAMCSHVDKPCSVTLIQQSSQSEITNEFSAMKIQPILLSTNMRERVRRPTAVCRNVTMQQGHESFTTGHCLLLKKEVLCL